MKCQNCPLCVSDYTDACGDGDIYCLVTGDYAKDEGGCSRTNQWILNQDRNALIEKRREEESRAWTEMAEYYENNRDVQSYRDEIKCLNVQIQELIDELSRRDSMIYNFRDDIKVKELADELIEEIFKCISDILLNNHRFPGPGEDFDPHYYEDVFEDVARLKIRLEEKYGLRCK